MNNLACACELSIRQLDALRGGFAEQLSVVERALSSLGQVSPPSNDPRNFILPAIYGGAGALISSSEAVKKFLNDIHQIAQTDDKPKNAFERIVRFLLGHKGDLLDKVDGEYIDRAGNPLWPGAHRLMWGHDIFSLGPDNPFVLLMRQRGSILGGIAQVFRHLVADTFSNQGLPIPFHSFFDYVGDNGKLGNTLWDVARAATNGGNAADITEAFGNLFTIKFADIATTGLTSALCAIHNHALNKDDEAAASQVRAIAYSSQFFGKAAIGVLKTGVPFISWPTAFMVVKEIYSLYRLNYRDIAVLEQATERLCLENARLEAEVFASGRDLVSHPGGAGYLTELRDFDARMYSLEGLFDR